MRSYLMIESRAEVESPDVTAHLTLAGELATAGHQVTVFLIQNGVLGIARSATIGELLDQGVPTWADEPSLRARGDCSLPAGVRRGGTTELVRMLMAPGVVPVWH